MANDTAKYEFTFESAGYTFRVLSVFESTKKFCEKYFTTCECPDYEIELSREMTDAAIKEAEEAVEKEGLVMGDLPYEYYEVLALHREVSERLPLVGTVMFHCSSVMVDDEGFLFTAKSGTGKSTHANLWQQYFGERLVYVNDDKPFITRDEDGFKVCGSPWNGKHHRGENVIVPIKAIGLITRDTTNFTERVKPFEAFTTLYQQVYLPNNTEARKVTIEIIKQMAETIPMYKIHCNMELEAAKKAYEGMR